MDFLNVAGVATAEGCRDRSGGLIGGQLGYRWQASGSGCLAWKLRAMGGSEQPAPQSLSILRSPPRTKTSGIGLFTGQIGYAWNTSLST